MKKIKVLMHSHPNSYSLNAQDLNGREIASRLNPDIFEVYFINVRDDDIDESLKKNNIKIVDIKSKNRYIQKLKVLKYKLINKFDVSFNVSVFFMDSVFLTLLPLFDKKRATYHSVENLLPYPNASKIYQLCARYNALKVKYLYSITSAVKDSVKKYYKKDTDIIHVGVDTKLFKIENIDFNKKKLKIVSIGSFQKRKQPDLFVEIAKKFPEHQFVWIGEGEMKGFLKDYIAKNKLSNIELLDNMKQDKLIEYLKGCDIFLFPSIHEGFPKVIIETMSCGLPAIVFDAYSPEAVINNETGFIVSAKEEMIEKLKFLIEDKDTREHFSIASKKRAKIFDWDIIAEKWEKVFINNSNR